MPAVRGSRHAHGHEAGKHCVFLRLRRSASAAAASVSYSGRRLPPTVAANGGGYGAGILQSTQETLMGKYFIAWLLGVPAFVLVIAYLIFH